MALGYYFNPPSGMTTEQYDETIRRLEQAGAGSPPGRTYHACFGQPDHLMVFDVWESEEQFNRFGETLMPILQEVGIDPGEPDVAQIHNVIEA
jgi:hypothetical protein